MYGKYAFFGYKPCFLEKKVTQQKPSTKTHPTEGWLEEPVPTALPYPIVPPLTIKNPPFPWAASSFLSRPNPPAGQLTPLPATGSGHFHCRFLGDFFRFLVQFRCEPEMGTKNKMAAANRKRGVFFQHVDFFCPKTGRNRT